jgi:hypothetical protein
MTTPTINIPKGLTAKNAHKVSDEEMEMTLPDWAVEAMKQGKQVVQRGGEFFLATHQNSEDEKRFGEKLNEAIDSQIIKGDHHDECDQGAIHHKISGGTTEYYYHLADGRTIHNTADLPNYTERQRHNLREATQEAISRKSWSLSWRTEDQTPETAGLTPQMRNYIDDAFDYDFYEDMSATLKMGWANEVEDCVNQKEIIFFLVGEWLKEQAQKKHIDFGKYGGDWNCGEHSGVWADFLLTVKSNPDFKGHQPIKGEFYIGVRLHATSVVRPFSSHIIGKWRPTFTIVSTELLYEPQDFGLTTVMMANYGKPFRPTVISNREKQLKAWVREKKEIEKAIARQALAEEQRRLQAEIKARREADEMERVLAETIKAYNEKATKDLIAFNRTHIAEPLRKRIEAKEAEREREEAERRHAEKMKQKELERLAKHAPTFKTKSR